MMLEDRISSLQDQSQHNRADSTSNAQSFESSLSKPDFARLTLKSTAARCTGSSMYDLQKAAAMMLASKIQPEHMLVL